MASIATMTGAQFDALAYEEGRRWELIEGELVEASSLHFSRVAAGGGQGGLKCFTDGVRGECGGEWD